MFKSDWKGSPSMGVLWLILASGLVITPERGLWGGL